MPVRYRPVNLAAAMAAFAQDRYCGRLGTGIAIPLVLPLLVGQRLLAGNAPSITILFNWAFGAIVLLVLLQLMLDLVTVVAMLAQRRWLRIPVSVQYVHLFERCAATFAHA